MQILSFFFAQLKTIIDVQRDSRNREIVKKLLNQFLLEIAF